MLVAGYDHLTAAGKGARDELVVISIVADLFKQRPAVHGSRFDKHKLQYGLEPDAGKSGGQFVCDSTIFIQYLRTDDQGRSVVPPCLYDAMRRAAEEYP
jgi:hypothetical protein